MPYILVVDDDAGSGMALCQFLRIAGYEVMAVPNGREALALILARTPDLLILDLFMPEMDGAGLLEILRSYLRLQSLPVIVFTGLPDSPAAERVKHLRVNTMLVKAKASPDDVLRAIEQQLPRAPK
jgi:CheY-like chemotaxis protein